MTEDRTEGLTEDVAERALDPFGPIRKFMILQLARFHDYVRLGTPGGWLDATESLFSPSTFGNEALTLEDPPGGYEDLEYVRARCTARTRVEAALYRIRAVNPRFDAGLYSFNLGFETFETMEREFWTAREAAEGIDTSLEGLWVNEDQLKLELKEARGRYDTFLVAACLRVLRDPRYEDTNRHWDEREAARRRLLALVDDEPLVSSTVLLFLGVEDDEIALYRD